MSTSRRGKDKIVYKGFTYSSKQNTKYWYCSTLNTCKAKLHLDQTLKIIGAFTDHNHPPPSLVRLRNDYDYEISRSSRGKDLLIFKGYTYNRYNYEVIRSKKGKDLLVYKGFTYYLRRATKLWYCSILKNCKARVRMENAKIVEANDHHSHPPPRLYRAPIKFMLSRNGESLMKLGDFTFTRMLFTGGTWCWSCYTHNNHGCKARVYTERHKLIYTKNYHNHPPTEFFV
ncbi:unnamed protein product [Danaus chrysippus]|uniref:(African queen) hypothetical protein n=1 Tax=Danaus chrysippus TaxID=151541 RepID=A0A8J2R364_9NEOP|nr:unnamed protein product [Danaus chrysippus]